MPVTGSLRMSPWWAAGLMPDALKLNRRIGEAGHGYRPRRHI
nr:hypothetical protein [Thermanaeromonas sp.]